MPMIELSYYCLPHLVVRFALVLVTLLEHRSLILHSYDENSTFNYIYEKKFKKEV